ncbi:MAG: response regulator transcription factor [Caldilineaceae bacterium]|nr:response regulator transcription factor [Caldilineaceae bacterium]MCB0138959.1 response regulator transcription factor [Caldilineaceae bacterium]
MRVLVVEDEPRMARLIRQGLEEDAYAVDVIGNGADALDWVQSADYDMVLLDILLPGMDGLAVCRQLRDHGYIMPILMLTALGTLPDKVSGLDSGADDYLVKPFAIQELTARLRALARRTGAQKSAILRIGDLHLDTAAKQAQRGDRHIELTAKEYALLETLMRNPNRVLSRDQLIDHIWNMDFAAESKLIEVYIYNLRKKIDDGFDQKLIQTVRGLGYRMVDHAEAA